jgi:PAS domain S-box-containing protein
LTGYTNDEILGQSLGCLNGPQTDRGVIEKLAMAIQEGRALRTVALHYRKNGIPFWNEITLTPIKNRTGRVVEHVWVMSDVTLRQQAEEALRATSDLSPLADRLSDGVIVTNDAAVVYVNPAALALLAVACQNEAVGKPIQAFFDSETSDFVRRCVRSHKPRDTVSHATGTLLRADGRTAAIRLSAAPIVWQGKGSCLLLVSQAAPCPQAAQERVAIAPDSVRDAELKLVMESVPGGVVMVRQDGTISLVNARVEQIFGYTQEELPGRPVDLLLPGYLHQTRDPSSPEVSPSPSPQPKEQVKNLSGRRKDGSRLLLETRLTPLQLTTGRSTLMTIYDRTDRRKAQEDARRHQAWFAPVARAAHVGRDEPLPHGHECVLFVDDEESLARFGGELLESLGYFPVVRRNATEALEAFRLAPQRFDLLIADQAMSGMNGDLLARECRQLRPDLPVILCAGSEPTLSEDESRPLSMVEFVLTPLTLHDLAHTIRRVLDSPRPTSAPHAEPSGRRRGPSTPLLKESDAIGVRH